MRRQGKNIIQTCRLCLQGERCGFIVSQCKVTDSPFCSAEVRFAPLLCLRDSLAQWWQRASFPEQKQSWAPRPTRGAGSVSQPASTELCSGTQAQMDWRASSKPPQLPQLHGIYRKAGRASPDNACANTLSSWSPSLSTTETNSCKCRRAFSDGALCRHLGLETFDTTVWVTSCDYGMLKSSLRNFSVIFSLRIFWCG